MGKGRLEAFSDGVIAIIITIMVLELKVPEGEELGGLHHLLPVFLSYVLSFVYVGIYWNNHHHLFQAVRQVNGKILWANLHLLFWLSLLPFVTHLAGENHRSATAVALYGVVLLMAAVAYFMLSRSLISHHGEGSALAQAVGGDAKGKISLGIYAVAIPLAWAAWWATVLLVALVAVIWLVPDRRIEKTLTSNAE
ncbi:MAG: DUF1211 domain-containing protein [Candidatus Latescibacteria bacterium]|nr:DUF1211 domain-containing protein [Candidatus Latescibacterota bacterium]